MAQQDTWKQKTQRHKQAETCCFSEDQWPLSFLSCAGAQCNKYDTREEETHKITLPLPATALFSLSSFLSNQIFKKIFWSLIFSKLSHAYTVYTVHMDMHPHDVETDYRVRGRQPKHTKILMEVQVCTITQRDQT